MPEEIEGLPLRLLAVREAVGANSAAEVSSLLRVGKMEDEDIRGGTGVGWDSVRSIVSLLLDLLPPKMGAIKLPRAMAWGHGMGITAL